MGNSITMKQSPQIKTETTYEAVGYDGSGTPIWKEIHVTKYNRFGKIVYDFVDLFHNMQLTESEYDEEGRHIRTTVRNLLLPDEEPYVLYGEKHKDENHAEIEIPALKENKLEDLSHYSLDDDYKIDIDSECLEEDEYGNWTLEKSISTTTRMVNGKEEKTIETNLYKRQIVYFEDVEE